MVDALAEAIESFHGELDHTHSVYALLRRLWRRFFVDDKGRPQEPPIELWNEVGVYLNGRGDFASM